MKLLRWVLLLPATISAGFVAYFLARAFLSLSFQELAMWDIDPTSTLSVSAQVLLANVAFGSSAIHAAYCVAPDWKREATMAVTTLWLLLAGANLLISLRTGSSHQLIGMAGMIPSIGITAFRLIRKGSDDAALTTQAPLSPSWTEDAELIETSEKLPQSAAVAAGAAGGTSAAAAISAKNLELFRTVSETVYQSGGQEFELWCRSVRDVLSDSIPETELNALATHDRYVDMVEGFVKQGHIGMYHRENGLPKRRSSLMASGVDFLYVVVSKEEIETRNITPALTALKALLVDRETAIKFCERVDLAFSGYDSTPDELYEIPKVRAYVHALDEEFPYWLYFLSKRHTGLLCIIHCFLPPCLTPEAKRVEFPKRLNEYLMKRGFRAMHEMCQFTRCSDSETERMAHRVMDYIVNGRTKGAP